MNTQGIIVGTYQKHSEAAEAVGKLKEAGFPIHTHVAIVGRGALVEDHLEIETATNALRNYMAFGLLVGIGVGIMLMFQMETRFTVENFLVSLSIGGLTGAALGLFKAYFIGPKGQLHLHKHWKLDQYQVALHDTTPEEVTKAKRLLGTIEVEEELVELE